MSVIPTTAAPIDGLDTAELLAMHLKSLFPQNVHRTSAELMVTDLLDRELKALGNVYVTGGQLLRKEDRDAGKPLRFSMEFGIEFGIAAAIALANLTPSEARRCVADLVYKLRVKVIERGETSLDFFEELRTELAAPRKAAPRRVPTTRKAKRSRG